MSEPTRFTIESPQDSDHSEWQRLYRLYADFYQVPMNDSILGNVWHWIQDENMPFYALVARDKTQGLAGFMHYRAMPSPLRGCLAGFVDDLYIDQHWRGQGIVDAMFATLEQKAAEYGWPLVRWITTENNYRGRAVYDRVGYKTHWQTYQIDISSNQSD